MKFRNTIYFPIKLSRIKKAIHKYRFPLLFVVDWEQKNCKVRVEFKQKGLFSIAELLIKLLHIMRASCIFHEINSCRFYLGIIYKICTKIKPLVLWKTAHTWKKLNFWTSFFFAKALNLRSSVNDVAHVFRCDHS